MSNFFCIGHRGASGYEPENTLQSFEKAIELGCNWIELDVYAVEGVLLVIHYDSLERTTNGKGEVMDASLEYLRSLDAGEGQQIPTLDEGASLVDQRCGINIELKGPDTAVPVSAYLKGICSIENDPNGWNIDQFLVSSFNHRELSLTDSDFRRGALFYKEIPDYFKRTTNLSAYAINLPLKLVSESIISAAHAKGLKVLVYNVNKSHDIEHMIKIGVDGVFCDYPDRVLTILESSSSA